MVATESGRTARDTAIARVEAAHPDEAEQVRAAIRALAASHYRFTADDLRQRLTFAPTPAVVGAAFMYLSRRGEIHRVGLARSTRTNQHAATLAYWSATPPVDSEQIVLAARRARALLHGGNARGARAALDAALGE